MSMNSCEGCGAQASVLSSDCRHTSLFDQVPEMSPLICAACAGAMSTISMVLMHRWMRMGWTALAPIPKSRAWQADQAVEAKGKPLRILEPT